MARRKNRNGVGPRAPRPHDSERAARWRGLVREWEKSGLSQVEFCRKREVSVHTFRSWRYALRLQVKEDRRVEEESPAFLEVKMPTEPALGAAKIEIDLGQGYVIRVHPGADTATLREVLTALGACTC